MIGRNFSSRHLDYDKPQRHWISNSIFFYFIVHQKTNHPYIGYYVGLLVRHNYILHLSYSMMMVMVACVCVCVCATNLFNNNSNKKIIWNEQVDLKRKYELIIFVSGVSHFGVSIKLNVTSSVLFMYPICSTYDLVRLRFGIWKKIHISGISSSNQSLLRQP